MTAAMDINERAPNRVPKGAVRLSEAFELLYRRLTPDFDGARHEDPHRLTFEAMSDAEVTLRRALASGELRAFIHNAGVDLELLRTEWLRYGDQVGIHSDYTDTKTPGPDCTVNGLPHPIFFHRTDFDHWLARWATPADKKCRSETVPSIGEVENSTKTALASRAFSMNEVIERTGLSKTTVYEAIADGKLRARKYGVRTLILETDLDVFLKNLPAATAG
jgi:excisionase family DNA binding protein